MARITAEELRNRFVYNFEKDLDAFFDRLRETTAPDDIAERGWVYMNGFGPRDSERPRDVAWRSALITALGQAGFTLSDPAGDGDVMKITWGSPRKILY